MGIYVSLNKFLIKATRNQIIQEENRLKDLHISKIYDEVDTITNQCNFCDNERNSENCKACVEEQQRLIDIKLSFVAELKKYFDILPSDPYLVG